MTLLTFDHVEFAYPERPATFTALSLQIRPGDRVGLIGPNGAGKTTLFLLACGVLTPRQGGIYLGDRPVRPGHFHSDIGLVFQNADDQLFCPTVADDVAFGPTEMGLSPGEIQNRVQSALTATGIEALADLPPHQLSGGQKRMVAIAGILACHPRITLYDEPSANLDAPARRRLINYLRQSTQPTIRDLHLREKGREKVREQGREQGAGATGFIVSSHDLPFIRATCNRVILLSGGRILADGPTHEILSDRPLLDTHGMDSPFNQAS
ncbi:MAG: energy-coupling factor ABC transporter ATP-binding protein [Cyanobacteria bacterium P01_H01_bin.130]